jgi:hypothetical protein
MSILSLSGYQSAGKDTVARIIQYLDWVHNAELAPTIPFHSMLKRLENGEFESFDQYSSWKNVKFAGKVKVIASLLTGIPVKNFEKQDVKNSLLGDEWNYYKVELYGNSPKDYADQRTIYLNCNDELVKQYTNDDDHIITHNTMSVRQFLQKLGTDAIRNQLHSNAWVNSLMCDYNVDSKWIISDCRFKNEFKTVRDNGGITIRINRVDQILKDLHISETDLDSGVTFDYIINNETNNFEKLVNDVKEIMLKENLL